MLDLQEDMILKKALDYIITLSKERKSILECLRRTLAEDIVAPEALPPFDYSTCDGYALNSHMSIGAAKNNPKYFSVLGVVCAGAIFDGEVKWNGAVNIMTGAPIPEGTDCVIPLELGEKQDNLLIIIDQVQSGMNVRKAGSDLARGSMVIKSGTIISPLEIGVLASLGRSSVEIIRRPIVSVAATGDEVIPLGGKKGKGQVFNSNALSIASLVSSYGGTPRLLDIIPDDKNKLRDSIIRSFESDLLITIGGTSSGLKDIVSEHGFEEISYGDSSYDNRFPLKILKGKDNKILPHLALPGKPVGCVVVFEFYGRSVLERMSGRGSTALKFCSATMQNEIINEGKANVYARVKLQKKQEFYMAWSTGKPDHDLICANVEANGFVFVPKTVEKVCIGDQVSVLVPGWSDI
jgi:molybdopterin molybdotransferase